jgi:hypothetical protein
MTTMKLLKLWSPMIGFVPWFRSEKNGETNSSTGAPLELEVEKAHPDVFNVLLQLLDDGRRYALCPDALLPR